MGFNLTMTGDWNKAGIKLKNLSKEIQPMFKAQLFEDGNLILETIKGHVENQDLDWKPLSERTVQLKNGDETIYVETGALVNGLVVRRIKSTLRDSTIYVGASPWKKHPSGLKMSDLMIMMEYGTSDMPARPLIRPTYEEVQDVIKNNWEELFKELVVK